MGCRSGVQDRRSHRAFTGRGPYPSAEVVPVRAANADPDKPLCRIDPFAIGCRVGPRPGRRRRALARRPPAAGAAIHQGSHPRSNPTVSRPEASTSLPSHAPTMQALRMAAASTPRRRGRIDRPREVEHQLAIVSLPGPPQPTVFPHLPTASDRNRRIPLSLIALTVSNAHQHDAASLSILRQRQRTKRAADHLQHWQRPPKLIVSRALVRPRSRPGPLCIQ